MTPPDLSFYTVDAFTSRPYAGNPAAVCFGAESLDDEEKQLIAREMNLSETAFIYPADNNGIRRLRWFTPVAEVPLCGHATLASAHVLLRERNEVGPARFQSASGPLSAGLQGDMLRMDFPCVAPKPAPAPPGLLNALGLRSEESSFLASQQIAVVVAGSERDVDRIRPGFAALSEALAPSSFMGVAVTARGRDPSADFISRFFAPHLGVDEDPVTGAAHAALAPYWGEALGKSEMSARQKSSRGGRVELRLRGDRVDLSGNAVTVARGTLLHPGVRASRSTRR